MKKLILGELHSEEALAFSEAWGIELPGSYCEEPRREHAALQEAVGLLDESYRGVIDFTGEEVAAFLDKVVSSPSLQLEDGNGQGSCLLSAKGRLLGCGLSISSGRLRGELLPAPGSPGRLCRCSAGGAL